MEGGRTGGLEREHQSPKWVLTISLVEKHGELGKKVEELKKCLRKAYLEEGEERDHVELEVRRKP